MSVPSRSSGKFVACNTCTIRLVELAYRRAPWFRVVREPLRLTMQAMARRYRLNAREFEVRTASCRGCPRFDKAALKDRSDMFRWLNERINPIFDAILESIVSPQEVKEANAYARAATAGEVETGASAGDSVSGETPV